MARQPLILALAALGCRRVSAYEGAFDEPIAAAVLQPEVGGPFREPVALVANAHGGQLVPLAVKQGRFLTDDPTVSYLRGNQLPTGGLRVLTSVAVTAPSVAEVTVWAGDARFGALLEVPWLLDCDALPDRRECEAPNPFGAPVEQGLTLDVLSAPESGNAIPEFRGKLGYTATETWTVTSDGVSWGVEGSRSGRQPTRATPGVAWSADQRRLNFTATEAGEAGDTYVVKTSSGLVEHAVGGTPTALSVAPGQALIAMVVRDVARDREVVRWFDPVAEAPAGTVDLPVDARPFRLAWTEDGQLLATDAERPAVWEIAPGALVAREHPMPWPTFDVAELRHGSDDGSPGPSTLYVVPRDGGAVWEFDRDTGEAMDLNPAKPGIQPIVVTTAISGIESIRQPYRMPEFDENGVRRSGRAVAVSLATGAAVFVAEDDGCLVSNSLGPRTAYGTTSATLDYDAAFIAETDVGPVLEPNGASVRHVIVNPCAGVAPGEVWTLRYDEVLQAWKVTGSYSGLQRALALEDERYVSDGGEISFVIRAGALPSRDGWEITFTVDSGVAVATGDNDGDTLRDVSLGTGGDPVRAVWRAGLLGPVGDVDDAEGWYPVDLRTGFIVPGGATNEVGRLDPTRALFDVGWD